MKYLKRFNESQTSMDFTGKLSQDVMTRLTRAKEYFTDKIVYLIKL